MKKKLNETLQVPIHSIIPELLPSDLFSMKKDGDRERVKKIVQNLKSTLNDFYKKNDIKITIK